MRVLLDECVPRTLREQLPGHEVKTVAESGWARVKNGELLLLAAKRFDVVLTVDRNLEYQQSFVGAEVAAVVIHALLTQSGTGLEPDPSATHVNRTAIDSLN